MANAREDAITTLAGVMALIDVANDAVDAALTAGDDPWLAKAKVVLGHAGKYVTRASGLLRSQFERPDGSLTLIGFLVSWTPALVAVGAVAYLCRGPLHLAAVWSALICVAALFGASAVLTPPWRAVTATYVPRRFTAERAARRNEASSGGTTLDVAACLDAILQARNDIGAVAVGRLNRYGPAGHDAAGLVAASRLDHVVASLRSADGALASGYDALVRWQAGVHA